MQSMHSHRELYRYHQIQRSNQQQDEDQEEDENDSYEEDEDDLGEGGGHGSRYRHHNYRGRLVAKKPPRCARLWMVGLLLATFGLFAYLPSLVQRRTKPSVFVWPRNQSRRASDFLLSSPEPLLAPELSSVCGEEEAGAQGPISLLVIVCSAIGNVKERQSIRDSWAGDSLRPRNTRVIFLLGSRRNQSSEEEQESLLRESAQFGDLLQQNFVDTYSNLTIKSLHLLDWYTSRCPGVPYVLKTDDDMYINLLTLSAVIERERDASHAAADSDGDLLLGSLICGAVPIRDGQNKWFCPQYMYSGRAYPNYLSGTAYVASRGAARKLMAVADRVPLFHLEDIYVTGMLAKEAKIRPKDHVGFSYQKQRPNACLYSQVISSHHLTTDEMERVARAIEKGPGQRPCTKLKAKRLRGYGPGKCKW